MISNHDEFPELDKLISEAPETQTLVSEPASAAGPVMSSLQIAEITGKNHADVLRDIRNVLEEAEIGLSKFASSYLNAQNKEQPCYLLPRRECDLVVSGYSVKYRLAIIDRWHELEAKATAPVALDLENPTVLKGLILASLEKVEALQTTVSELTPKAEALDRISNADGSMCITNAAKALQRKPRQVFAWLQANGWIFRRGAEWNSYQSKISQGLLAHKVTVAKRADDTERTCIQTLVTSKGLTTLAKLIPAT